MEKTVLFRDFEERDIDFIYKCKNDSELNKLVVGQYHPFTYDEAATWVHGCMGEHETFKFWAVCTNDDEKRIVGWISVSRIDYVNKSACFHGIVIADPLYRDGFAWIDCYLFVFEYIFEVLKLNRLYGESLAGHRQSNAAGIIFYYTHEGTKRQSVYKNNRYYDVYLGSVLSHEYFEHKRNGDYKIRSIIKRVRTLRKQQLI